MVKQHKAYGDGRIWDDFQREYVAEVVGDLQLAISKNDLGSLRRSTLWIMDLIFPTGFTYEVNRAPSEAVHGGYMEGDRRG